VAGAVAQYHQDFRLTQATHVVKVTAYFGQGLKPQRVREGQQIQRGFIGQEGLLDAAGVAEALHEFGVLLRDAGVGFLKLGFLVGDEVSLLAGLAVQAP